MPLQLTCKCRRVLQIPDTLRAAQVLCPGCHQNVPIPVKGSPAPTVAAAPPKSGPKLGKPVTKTARGVAPPPPSMPAGKRQSWAIPIVLACLAFPLLLGVPFLLASLGGGDRPEPTVAVVPEDDGPDVAGPGRDVFGTVGKARVGGRSQVGGPNHLAEGEMPIPSVTGANPLVKPRTTVAKPDVKEEEDLALLRDRVKEQERSAEERARRLEELRALKKARGVDMQLKKAELDALSKGLSSDVLRAAQKRIEGERQKVANAQSAADAARQKQFDELRAVNRAKADALIQEGAQRMKSGEFRLAADAFAAAKMIVPYDDDVDLLFREARKMEDRDSKFDDQERADRAMKLVKAAKAVKPNLDEELDRTRAADQAWLRGVDEQDERSAVLGRAAMKGLREGTDRAAKAGAAQNAAMRAMGDRAVAAGQAQMGALRAQGQRAASAMRAAREALMVEGMRAGWAGRAQMVGLGEQGNRAVAAGKAQAAGMRAQDQRIVEAAKQQNAMMREQNQRAAGAALQQAANMRAQTERVVVAGEEQKGAMRAATDRAAGAGRVSTAAMIAQGERSAVVGREIAEDLRNGSDRAAKAGREANAALNTGSERAGSAGRAAIENIKGQDRTGNSTAKLDEETDRTRKANQGSLERFQDAPPPNEVPKGGGATRPPVTEERQQISAEAQKLLDQLRAAELQKKAERDAAAQRAEHERELAELKNKKTAADKEEDELKRLEAELAQGADAELRIKAIQAELELRAKTGGAIGKP